MGGKAKITKGNREKWNWVGMKRIVKIVKERKGVETGMKGRKQIV